MIATKPKRCITKRLLASALICVFGISNAYGNKPLWEIGIGGISSYMPDYPAAGQNHLNWIPFPVFIYRGNIFRSDVESGLSGKVVNEGRFKLKLSFDGSFSADSSKNDARQGMPDLDYLFEGGPMLSIILNNPKSKARLTLNIPARAVISTNIKNVKYRGYLTQPGLNLQIRNFPTKESYLSFNLSTVVADTKINQYFYNVAPEYATATRPQYTARAGLISNEFNIRQKFKLGNHALAFSYTLLSHHRTVNQASPLFINKWNQIFTASLVLILFSSDSKDSQN